MRAPLMRTLAAMIGASGAIATTTPAQAQVTPGWHGTYTYSESIPRSGGVTGSIDYRLTLGPRGACRIDAQGVMTDLHLRCAARSSGNSIAIAFVSHVGASNDVRFRRGTPLLRLTRTPGGLVTAWQALTPSDARRHTGRYFRKRLS